MDGTLRHRDREGHETDIHAGEMQLIRAGRRGIRHKATNPHDAPERHYPFWLTPDASSLESAYHERAPYPEQRRAQLKRYASPDGRGHSMPLRTDALVYAGLFSAGDPVRHELGAARGAWLQVVAGAVQWEGTRLSAGDGVGITGTSRLSLAVEVESNLLLMTLPSPS